MTDEADFPSTNRRTGEVTGRIVGHLPAVTFRLVLSADGRYLTAMLGEGGLASNLNLAILRTAGSIRGASGGRSDIMASPLIATRQPSSLQGPVDVPPCHITTSIGHRGLAVRCARSDLRRPLFYELAKLLSVRRWTQVVDKSQRV